MKTIRESMFYVEFNRIFVKRSILSVIYQDLPIQVRPGLFWAFIDRMNNSFSDAHLLNTNITWVKEEFRYAESFVVEANKLKIQMCFHHLLIPKCFSYS